MTAIPTLFSLTGLARELQRDRRTITRALTGIEPDGTLRGRPAWTIPTTLLTLAGPIPAPAPVTSTDVPPSPVLPQKLADWMELHIVVPIGTSAEPGPLKLWPWQRGIADAIGDPNIERITLVKPVRVGFTTLLTSAIASYIVNDPSPILCLLPTEADCRDYMVSEIESIFGESPALVGRLAMPRAGERSGRERSTLLHRLFRGGSLKIVAAKAPRNLRRHTARVLICDEVDGMEVTAEGPPVTLAERRTLSFANRKIVIGSTPLDEDTSTVLRSYAQSDMRVFEAPCASCGVFHEITWAMIEWEPNRPETAAFRCPSCGDLVSEATKPAMVAQGRWRATAGPANGHAGFRLNALVSLLPNASWAKLAAEFLAAKDDPALLRVFVNTILGQGWKPTGEEIDEHELGKRAEPFSLDNIPAEVIAITIGCDVQDDRLEPTIAGWTKTGECLVLQHEAIYGPIDNDAVWQDLDDLLKSRWRHPHGGMLKIDAAVIDAGDGGHYDRVMAFCGPRAGRRVLAGKGVSGFGRPAIKPSTSGKVRGGKRLWLCGVNSIKQTLFSRLARGRFYRFSSGLDPTYFEQLTSEKRVVRYSRGKPTPRFERIVGRRAETLDALVLATAARAMLTLNIQIRETELRSPVPPARVPAPTLIRSEWMAR